MTVNILVVDDSLPMRAVIIKTIKASGYSAANFYEAGDGQEALKILKDQWMDIVLSDYNMPDMNGLELISAIKNDEILESIPVLIVTTEGSRSRIDDFIEKGAAGYIKKPFTPETIKQKLTEILGEMPDENGFEEGAEDLDF